MKISKYQWGGPSTYLTQLASKSPEEVKEDVKKTEPLQYAIPVYGTYLSWRDFAKDPSFINAGLATLSTVGDIGSAFGVGELANLYVAGVKNAPKLAKATKALNEGEKAYRSAEKLAFKTAQNYQKAKNAERAATLAGATTLQQSKYTKAAADARIAMNEAYSQAGKEALKLNGLTPKLNIGNTAYKTSGSNAGVLVKSNSVPANKDLFFIGENYGGSTGLQGLYRLAKQAMPREITKSDKTFPLLMYTTGHAPTTINAYGTEASKTPELKFGGTLNYLNYINNVGRII